MTRDELIEKARQLIDDEVLTRTGRSVGDLASGHVARALADAGLLADPAQHDDRYAVIHVSPRPGSDAWPIVERVPGGWQSGAHHYPDEDVIDVQPLPIPKHECDATLVERMHDAEAAATRAQAEAAAAWRQVEDARSALQGNQPTEPSSLDTRRQFGEEHVFALSVARSAVLKAARKFVTAGDMYRQRDLVHSVKLMASSERACHRVASLLAEEIARAQPAGEADHG